MDNKEYMREYRKKHPDRVIASRSKLDKPKQNEKARDRHRRDPLKTLVRWTKKSAKLRGLEHSITRDDVEAPPVCPVLKTPFIVGDKDLAMSIDRIDNTRGYVPGNVQIISRLANRMKSNATTDQLKLFSDWIQNG